MALDDGAQIDPATLPENRKLMQELDALSRATPPPLTAPARGAMRELLVEAVAVASSGLAEALEVRAGDHPLEEDLRTALAIALSRTDAAVFTEAKLRLSGWTPNLGGFDIVTAGAEGSLILIETKWGNVWQGIWDVVKLASGHQHPRVTAAYAVYAATPTEWGKYVERELFMTDGSRSSVTDYLLEEYQDEWAWNLKGSPTVYPSELPAGMTVTAVHEETVTLLARAYEVRVVSVEAGLGPPLELPRGQPPST